MEALLTALSQKMKEINNLKSMACTVEKSYTTVFELFQNSTCPHGRRYSKFNRKCALLNLKVYMTGPIHFLGKKYSFFG